MANDEEDDPNFRLSSSLLHTYPARIYRAVDTYPSLPSDLVQHKQVVITNTEATLLLIHSTNGIKIKVTQNFLS